MKPDLPLIELVRTTLRVMMRAERQGRSFKATLTDLEALNDDRRDIMVEKWQSEPRSVVRMLVERGSEYDVAYLEKIYAEDQYILFVREGGIIDRADRAQTIAKFQAWSDQNAEPLLKDAEELHAEIDADDGLILLRRKMRSDEPPRLYEIRLRRYGSHWKVVGETVSPWPIDHK